MCSVTQMCVCQLRAWLLAYETAYENCGVFQSERQNLTNHRQGMYKWFDQLPITVLSTVLHQLAAVKHELGSAQGQFDCPVGLPDPFLHINTMRPGCIAGSTSTHTKSYIRHFRACALD